jgi:hypothetical protein
MVRKNRPRQGAEDGGGGGGSADFIYQFVTPETIPVITAAIATAIGLAKTSIEGIRLWVEDRKSRRIKIKVADKEIEITGAMDEATIVRALKALGEVSKNDIKVIVTE